MRLINIARRSLALSIALLILIFSCCYVSFRSDTVEVSGQITITAKAYKAGSLKSKTGHLAKKKPAPFSEKLPSHPKLALNKRLVISAFTLFILSFLYFLFFRINNYLTDNYLKRSYPANLLLFLCAWRIWALIIFCCSIYPVQQLSTFSSQISYSSNL